MSGHGEASNIFILPNFTIVFEVVAFLLLLWFLARYVLPPVQRGMSARQEYIRAQIADSEAAKTRLERAEAEYAEAVARTRAELTEIREQAHADAARTREELLAAAREEAERIRVRAEEQLAAERARAIGELRGEVGRLATELAGRIVGEALADSELQHRVIDRFLADFQGRETERTG
jgi:F-type H+-transporting ATPase subunit b